MEKALEILNLIESKGFKAFIVGGAVRDYILQKKDSVYDYDLCSNISEAAIFELFEVKSNLWNSYKILFKDISFDLTVFRTEGNSSDSRHPDEVQLTQNYLDDSKRRDFTINSLYMDKNQKIYDPQNGIHDLSQKKIRLIGDKSARFKEDAVRILRAIYFKNKLNFEIEPETYGQILIDRPLVKLISKQKVLELLKKMFQLNQFTNIINDLYQTKVYSFLACFEKSIEFCQKHRVETLSLLEFFCLTQILDDTFLDTYEVSKEQKSFIRDVSNLSYVTSEDEIHRLLLFTYKLDKCLIAAKLNHFLYQKEVNLSEIEQQYQELPIKNVCDLKFKGYDLIRNYQLKSVSIISTVVDDIKFQVLMKNLPNDFDKIRNYVENKYKGVFINE